MAVSPSAHLPTTPNEHPVAAGHLGNGVEAAGAANEAVQPPDIAAESVCSDGMENRQPLADDFSTTTHPVVLPTHPNPHPVAARHVGDGVEAADAAKEAYLPPDTSADVATTLPPPPPSPDTIPMASKAMATSSTAIPTAFQPRSGANVMVPAFMGPSQHVEEVLALSQIRGNTRICDRYECPSISNCNAEEGDERGRTERIADTPSESIDDEKDTTEVSSVPFYLFNWKPNIVHNLHYPLFSILQIIPSPSGINLLIHKYHWINSQLLPLAQTKKERREAAPALAVTNEPEIKKAPNQVHHQINSLHPQSCSLNPLQMSLPNSGQSTSDEKLLEIDWSTRNGRVNGRSSAWKRHKMSYLTCVIKSLVLSTLTN